MLEEVLAVSEVIVGEEVKESFSFEESFVKMAREGGEREAWIAALETLYGKELISRVNFSVGTKNFDKIECLEHLSQLGHLITIDDVNHFFEMALRGDKTYRILEYLNVPYLGYYYKACLSDFDHQGAANFIDLFRDPLKLIDPAGKTLAEELYEAHTAKTITTYDHLLNRLIEKGNRSAIEFPYASRELLARKFAYVSSKNVKVGALVPIFNHETGRVFDYLLKGQVHKNGLHCYVLVPLKDDPRLPVQLIFRGTSGRSSILRNLDPSGVGKRAFDSCVDEILSLLQDCKNYKIEVIGHSLGAADAQRAMVLLTGTQTPFRKLTLFAFCTPKLDVETVNQWKENLRSLPPEMQIHLNFAQHEKDIVILAGDENISSGGSPQVHWNCLNVHSESWSHYVQLHHTVPFFKDGNFDHDVDHRSFKLYWSRTRAELEKELEKLESLERSWWWIQWLKKRFTMVETREEVEKRIDQLQKEKAALDKMEKSYSNQSSTSYIITRSYGYTIQPAIYQAFRGYRYLLS